MLCDERTVARKQKPAFGLTSPEEDGQHICTNHAPSHTPSPSSLTNVGHMGHKREGGAGAAELVRGASIEQRVGAARTVRGPRQQRCQSRGRGRSRWRGVARIGVVARSRWRGVAKVAAGARSRDDGVAKVVARVRMANQALRQSRLWHGRGPHRRALLDKPRHAEKNDLQFCKRNDPRGARGALSRASACATAPTVTTPPARSVPQPRY